MSRSVNDFSRYPKLPAKLVNDARVLPNRNAALGLWPQDAVIVEIGVALGDFSNAIMQVCKPRKFIAIDRFDLHGLTELWGKPTKELFGGRTHADFYANRFASEVAAGKVELIQGDSAPSISSLPDESVDVFYVDADHSYEGVRQDLEALAPKIKPDGWIIMNDYTPQDTFFDCPFGVIQATHEFMLERDWEMVYLALAPIMYCDVGLRRRGGAPPTALERHAAELESSLAAMRRSTSWRLTAPLRGLVTALRPKP